MTMNELTGTLFALLAGVVAILGYYLIR